MLASKLNDAVSNGLIEHVEAMLTQVACVPEVRANVTDYARSRMAAVSELTDALGDPDDEVELYRSAAFLWLELKAEWVRFNQTMQYQVARRGKAEMTVFIKGAVASHILSRVEPLLRPGDVDVLTTMTAEPLQSGQPDIAQIKRFLAHQDDLMSHIGRMFRSASSISGGIFSIEGPLGGTTHVPPPALSSSLAGLAHRYARFFDGLLQETQEALLVPRELLWPAYVNAIHEGAAVGGRRIDVQDESKPGSRIDLRLARIAEELVAAAAMVALERTLPGPDNHSSVSIAIDSTETLTRITVACDRSGAPAEGRDDAPAWRDFVSKAERADADITATTTTHDRVTVLLEIPTARLSGAESFLVIPGAAIPCCIPKSRVEVLACRDASGDETWVDLRQPGEELRAVLRVRTQHGRHVILACAHKPREIRGLTLPIASASELPADCFDFAVISGDGAFGVFGARALSRITPPVTPAEAA